MASALAASSVAPSLSFICNGLNPLSFRSQNPSPTTTPRHPSESFTRNPLQPQHGDQNHQGLVQGQAHHNSSDEVSKYMIEGDLSWFNGLAIRRLKEIQCYRGMRHIQGLLCSGQRTKNNRRTLKGKKVAIAGKKKAAPRYLINSRMVMRASLSGKFMSMRVSYIIS